MYKTGYVALIGRPNSGKSTFLNALLGEKVSIVSPRPQTTARTITGIYTDSDMQIVFLDTPGLHEGGSLFTEHINREALRSLREADIILHFLDPTRPKGKEEENIEHILSSLTIPILRIGTKADLPSGYPHAHLDQSISSITKTGFQELLEKIRSLLPEGPALYDESYYTVQDRELRIGEVIREALFWTLDEEVPYASYVAVSEIDDTPEMLRILAYIHTETDSQKGIVIGKGGKKLQEIGTLARTSLESIFGKRVYLALRVKVSRNWRKDSRLLDILFPKS